LGSNRLQNSKEAPLEFSFTLFVQLLAEKAEPILGFKPSSKFKRGPLGILIYVVCGIIVFFSLRSAGVF